MKETICGILFVFMFNCVVINAQIEDLETHITFVIHLRQVPQVGTL